MRMPRGRLMSILLAGIFLSPLHPAWTKEKLRRSEQPAKARARERVLPLPEKGDRAITIDGDLTDWDGIAAGRGFVQQEIDYLTETRPSVARDAATVRLLRGDDALFVAVRVVDASIENSFEGIDVYQADCVELYLDLRPLASTNSPILGDSPRSAGVYQLLLVPPTAQSAKPRWKDVHEKDDPIGPFEFAARRLDDGYMVELRIPYSSLRGASATRLREPIGFELIVDDRDTGGQGYNIYSWSGLAGSYNTPASLGIADPQLKANQRPPLVRIEPAKLSVENVKSIVRSTVVAQRDAAVLKKPAALISNFESSVFDTPATTNPASATLSAQPKIAAEEPRIIDYPQLGVALRQESLRIDELAAGRYSFSTRITGQKGAGKTSHFYATAGDTGVQLQEIAPDAAPKDVLAGLAGSSLYVKVEDNFPFIGEKVTGTLDLDLKPALSWQLSQQAGQAFKEKSDRFYKLRVVALNESGREVAEQTFPLQQITKNLAYTLDVLPVGQYTVRVKAVDPNGREMATAYQQNWGTMPHTIEPGSEFKVIPPRASVLKTTVADAPKVLQHAIEIGSPNRERFPKDDWADSFARGVRELRLYEGRLYIGCGDYYANRGPIDIWSFAPVGIEAISQANFRKEFTVDDESAEVIRAYNGRLYVPGIDAKEDWKFGNLYVKEGGQWTKHRTIPNGLHLLDAAEYDSKLYVTTGTETGSSFFESADGGKSWRLAVQHPGEGRFGRMTPLRDGLLVLPQYGATPFLFRDGKDRKLRIPFFPRLEKSHSQAANRLVTFGDGAVYAATPEMLDIKDRVPLFFLRDFNAGALMIEHFSHAQVRDIKVENGVCYVLTGKQSGTNSSEFSGEVFSSTNLRSWKRLASATFPALPNALAVAEGRFYIGLAVDWSWYQPPNQQIAVPAAGSVWVLKE